MHFEKKLTVLVNSCDAYEDLWYPFFVLYKKFGNLPGVQILLNTESKTFSMEGIQINCIHSPKGIGYGGRILNALRNVETEYVLMMLDDFFLRDYLDIEKIKQILDWMDADKKIACFNSEKLNCYAPFEAEKYPGYSRVPPANNYACNMQAAIWRTDYLKKYWKPKVSPWEWEEYCSLLTARFVDHKIYCKTENGSSWIDYGHYATGDLWAVVRGKWVLSDVKPLFERENIQVNFEKRGSYNFEHMTAVDTSISRKGVYADLIVRSLGIFGMFEYLQYRLKKIFKKNGLEQEVEFFEYLQKKAIIRFLKKDRG